MFWTLEVPFKTGFTVRRSANWICFRHQVQEGERILFSCASYKDTSHTVASKQPQDFFFNSWGGMRLNSRGASAIMEPILPAPGNMSMQHSSEWELAVETEVLGEKLPPCNSVHHQSHMPSNPGRHGEKPTTRRLCYSTANHKILVFFWWWLYKLLVIS
jgi:hypothetical protein